MIEGRHNYNLCAHIEISMKSMGGQVVYTYIPDGKPIPPETTVVKLYSEGDIVPNGAIQGIHDHKGTASFGAPKFITSMGIVGDSIPVIDVVATNK